MLIKKIINDITTHIDSDFLNKKIILGLSGGPDSVFLFHVLKKLNVDFVAAHLDHGWRERAHEDVQFCEQLCAQHSIPFAHAHAKDLDVAIKANGSKEDVGRKLRRHFFEKVRAEHGANYIALAHHRQDQQETFFMRLMRGATLSGLTGIKPINGFYVRPLLSTNKKDILDYLHKHNIAYQVDESNDSPAFLRNRIRANILPAVRACDDRFDKKFESTLMHLQKEDAYLDTCARESYAKIFTDGHGDLKALDQLDPVLQRRVLIHWLISQNVPFSISDAYLKEISRFLLNGNGGEHAVHAEWAIVKKRNAFWIEIKSQDREIES